MSDQDEFLAKMRRQFEAAKEDEKELREAFIDDLRFASPDGEGQWDAALKQQREAARRPVMVFPRCHTFVRQVANEARQQKPQIKFAPSLDEHKPTADVIEGIARKIQYDSEAQIAYDTAVEYSASASFGYYRILTDYCDDESDDQEIKVVTVRDPLTVYGVLVPAIFGRKPRCWFVIENMPKDEYKETYPKSEIASLPWAEAEKMGDGWVGSDSVQIAEYWWITEESVKGKRKPKTTIHFCKTNGTEILPNPNGESSKTLWPGTVCPIVPVLGGFVIQEGKPKLFSVVRPQKSAQQMLNYAKSRIAETLATAPISPWVAMKGQISGNPGPWLTSNSNPNVVLEYEGTDINGHPAPPPQRQVFEPPIAALSSFVAQEVDDMKATSGIFDASLGAKANETSGQAILQRKQQADINNLHFMDNLERSFKQGGDVIAELIPKIYDAEREITILGEDEAQKVVTINKPHTDANGKPLHYDVAGFKGKYVVTMGKSYSSRRAESFDTMAQIIQTAPNMFPMIGDIMLRNSDMAGADEAADRLHAMLPPALQKNDNPIPPEAQAQIAQAQQQMQVMQQHIQELTAEKMGKAWEHQGKMQQIAAQAQANMALEKMKLENALAIAEVETKAQNINERIAAVEDMMKQFHAQAHDIAMQKDQQAHDKQIADQQAANQAALAEQGAQHDSALADQNAANQSAQSAQDAEQSQQAQGTE